MSDLGVTERTGPSSTKGSSNVLTNYAFFWHVTVAVTYLSISAAILAVLYVLLLPKFDSSFASISVGNPASPLTISGSSFTPRLSGGSVFEGRNVIVTGLKNGEAILASEQNLNTSDYQFAHFEADGLHPGLKLFIFWQTEEQPGGVFYAEVPLPPGGSGWFNLMRESVWQGTVRKLEVGVFGDLRGGEFRLRQVTLHPYSARGLLGTVWTEWRIFKPWSQASINAYLGGPQGALISPVAAISAWFLLSASGIGLTHLLGLRKVRGKAAPKRLGDAPKTNLLFALVITWLTLDGLWITHLLQQRQETSRIYAGKTLLQKKLSDWDGQFFRLAMEIKAAKKTGQRHLTILVPPNEGSTAFAYRLRYHLLPEILAVHITDFDPTQLKQGIGSTDLFLALSQSKSFQQSVYEQLSDRAVNERVTAELSNAHGLLLSIERPKE